MKICIFGAGAVGGYLAARIAARGAAQVSIVARGAQLAAIRKNGLKVLLPGEEIVARVDHATDDPATLAPQDVVIVTLKTNSQPGCARQIAALLGPAGFAIFASNGIPWWWNIGRPDNAPLPLLDPQGELWRALAPARATGCVVYSPNEVIEPGVIRHTGNDRWVLGEPAAPVRERLGAIVALFEDSGVPAEVVPDLRREIWIKLLRNAPLNSLCTLTRLPVDALSARADLIAMSHAIVDEVVAVALAQGWDIAERSAAAKQAPARGGGAKGAAASGMKPSMLQDVLAGRSIEVESILGQVREFAAAAGIATPAIGAVLPLLRGLDESLRSARV